MAKMIKKCIICGNEFEARNKANIYCSPECCSIRNQNKQKEKYANNKKEYIRFLYRKYVNGARGRGIEWNVSANTFESFIGKPCTYCGSDVKGVGIDRVDSKIGYVAGNIVSCCTACNLMKLRMNVDVFLSKIKQIHDHLKL